MWKFICHLFSLNYDEHPIEPQSRTKKVNGFIKSHGSHLHEATMTIYPSGICVVYWCGNNFEATPVRWSGENASEYEIADNWYGFTKFLVGEE